MAPVPKRRLKKNVKTKKPDLKSIGRKRNTKNKSFETFFRVLEKSLGECGVTDKSMSVVTSFIEDICRDVTKIPRPARINKRPTNKTKKIRKTATNVLPGAVARLVLTALIKAAVIFICSC